MSSRLQRDEALEKEDRIDEMKTITTTTKKQPTHTAPAASTAGTCPTICQSSRTPQHWKLPAPSPDPTTHEISREQLFDGQDIITEIL